MFKDIVAFIQQTYRTKDFIPLHEPRFSGNEKRYVCDTIDSTFVSSVGAYVDQFERRIAEYLGTKYAVATVNGTAALHIALKVAGVKHNDEVITQPLTFIATCNAINYCGAEPVFVDVDMDTMGMSPTKLEEWLLLNAYVDGDCCINKHSGKVIRACVPMHTFGHPVRLNQLQAICERYQLVLVEDAAESLGSTYRGKATGTFGKVSAFSFNGNKIITTGGGGMMVTDDELLAKQAKHLTTTAKVAHQWECIHDQIGFNYRMPNLNAALGCAQLEQLPTFVIKKRMLAERYQAFFQDRGIEFITEPCGSQSNYWLQTIILNDKQIRDEFLAFTNNCGIATRPAWQLANRHPMFSHCQCGDLESAHWLADRLINIPSSVPKTFD